ncbi:MAG: hypothetical protein PHZ19_01350 [Candidatus Thermoplasmatota archaeon]|nr:hypothetical protein [Candidatus Thermoplasmatota archaeon]
MVDEREMEHLRVVLDYLPCDNCEQVTTEEERTYLCTVCHRLSRNVVAEITVPRWRAQDGEVIPVEGRDIEELRPDVSIFEEEGEPEVEEYEQLEVLEIGVEVEVSGDEESEECLPEWETVDTGAYTHGEYTLYTKEVELRGGRQQRIYFFSKKEKQEAEPCPLPEGYKVKVNQKTGLPVLKKAD